MGRPVGLFTRSYTILPDRTKLLPVGSQSSFVSENGSHPLLGSSSSSSRYTRALSRRLNSTSKHQIWGEVNWRIYSLPLMGMTKEQNMSDSSPYTSESTSVNSSAENSPRSPVDQHSNWRLDIDGMSYEELITLGESIGNVCTGVPEDRIPECLTAKNCSIEDQNQGKSCPICLEVYCISQEIGTINNCRHDYHHLCIKMWLLMKNSCPMCNCTALVIS